MNNYSIFLENGILRVLNKTRRKELTKNEIYVLLHDLDNNEKTKVFAAGEKIVIRCARLCANATLENPEEIVKSKYRYMFKKSLDKINEGIRIIQIEKNKEKMLKAQKALKISGFIAPLVLIAALNTTNNNKDINIDYKDFMEPIPKEDLISSNDAVKRDIIESINTEHLLKEKLVEVKNKDEEVNINQIDTIYNKEENTSINHSEYNVALNIEDKSLNSDIMQIQDKYNNEFLKAGKKWGVSPEFLKGVMTHESHANEINLMQIVFKAFEDQKMDVYNYQDDRWTNAVLTNHPGDFNDVEIRISEEELNNPYTNIATSAILFNYSTNVLKTDNIFAICDYYNKGYGNFFKNINAYEANSGLSKEQILSDPLNTEFLNYAYICGQGDPNYVANVFQYIPNTENGSIYFYRMDNNEKKLITVNVEKTLTNTYASAR